MIVIKWRFKCQPQRERVFVLCYVTALQQKKTTTDSDIGRASSVVFIGDEKLEKMQKYKHSQTAGEENE